MINFSDNHIGFSVDSVLIFNPKAKKKEAPAI
jgi:hypothetical protein